MFIENDTVTRIKEFISGKKLTYQLSNVIVSSFDLVDKTNYEEILQSVKTKLNQSVIEVHCDVFAITTECELSKKELAVLVRYVNICQGSKQYFITINGDLVYIDSEYEGYTTEAITRHVSIVLSQAEHEKKLDQLKSKAKRIANPLNIHFAFR